MNIAIAAASGWIAVFSVLFAWNRDQRRHEESMRSLLDRIATEPRIEVRPAVTAPVPSASARKYIADHPADDAAWNEFRGDPEEDSD